MFFINQKADGNVDWFTKYFEKEVESYSKQDKKILIHFVDGTTERLSEYQAFCITGDITL